MNVLQFFYNVIIYPLEMIYELIYSLSMSIVPIAGVSIIVLSLFINTILIPVYKMLSLMQHEQEKKEADVEYWRKHIRDNFVGDERFFMLRTLYRQKGYNPLGSLKGSLPLLIQLPFFIAAYHFLTSLSQLNGVPFLIIKNIGKPDGIIAFESFRINILPIIMTLINVVSSYIYVKNQSLVNKLSVYGLAMVFFVVLYNSPSGLVLYWTLNNIFTLLKNIVFSKENTINSENVSISGDNSILHFLVCEIAIILLLGIVIPTTVIKSSPLEFVDLANIQNPLRFLYGSIIISAGFCLWLFFFFYISKSAREKFQLYITAFLFIGIIDSFFFGTRLGYISSNLKYINGLVFSAKEYIINVLSIVCVILVVFIMFKRFKKQLFFANFVVMIALTVFSIINIGSIENKYAHANWAETKNDNLSIPLSKDGKNVIVFMLDRAISGYIPYIMNEKPELKKQFAGFTYYPNTISFGINTGTGSACVFGGYDYIFNSKDVKEGFSVEKRNQALKLMPQLFSDKGYKVTIFDPPFANGQEVSDLSIYDDMSVRAFHAEDKFRYSYSDNDSVDRRFRNFFCYSLCKSVPLLMQYKIYDDGYYNDVTVFATTSVSSFVNENDDKSKGISYIYTFEREYAELCNLSNITEIVPGKENTFFGIQSGNT
jgi:YidC/Oxa1 family membrane protein insertase